MALSVWVAAAACSADESSDGGDNPVCDPGAERDCERNDEPGTEACNASGTAWGRCVTEADPGGSGGAGAMPGAGGSSVGGNGGGSGGSPTPDAGPDAAPPPACDLGALPDPSSGAEAGDTESFVVAVRELSYGDNASTVGFAANSACTPPGSEPWEQPEDCAATNGIAALLSESEADASKVDEFLELGQGTLLLRVRDYNGKSSDDQVSVDLLSTAAIDALDEDAVAAWDGNDEWPVRADSVDLEAPAPILAPLYSDPTGYISDGQLAARMDSAKVWLPFAAGNRDRPYLEFELRDVRLTCTVTGDYPLWQLEDCILGGEWPETSFLGSFAQIRDPLEPDVFLCQGAQSYQLTREFYCGFATVGGMDRCNAIAFGARFQTVPALISNLFEVDQPTTPCGMNDDPGSDSCYTDE